MTSEAKRVRGRIRAVASAIAIGAFVGIINSPLNHFEDQALAAGEVITVEPGTAARGEFITVTVSRISSSTFCSYLPFAGDGYFMRVYLLDYATGDNFHLFPQQSETFNPSTQQSLTLRVGPIPDRYPLGQISVVGDCMYPDGRQTGNTAVPFTLTVVEAGQSAPDPSPAPSAPAPNSAQPADQPATVNESAAEMEIPALEERVSRQTPQPAQELAFSVSSGQEADRSSVVVEGFVPSWATTVTVYLVNGLTQTPLFNFTVDSGHFSEVVRIPESTGAGEYLLRAESERGCPPPSRTCLMSTEATISVTTNSVEIFGLSVPRTAERTTDQITLVLVGLSIAGLILAVVAISRYRRS